MSSDTAFNVLPPSPRFGQTVTLTATVSPAFATGAVSFMDQGVLIGSGRLNANGIAQATTLTLPAGKHSILAVYGGDSNDRPSVSPAIPFVVTAAPGSGFEPAKNYVVRPQGDLGYMVVGDLNGGGIADVVVASPTGLTSVSVLLGKGDGTFQPATNYSVFVDPQSLAIGDFNGDGKEDVAVACGESNNVAVLLGNGDGTLQAPVYYPVGNDAESVAVGDFNGDGKADLAVADLEGPGLSLLLGNGDGTFLKTLNVQIVADPVAVATADLNGDGISDLVLGGSPVTVLLGRGDGTFQSPAYYLNSNGGEIPGSVAIADFNGDGNPDLAITILNADPSQPSMIAVMLGNGDGSFRDPVNYAGAGNSVVVGDFNGDGKLDLAASNGSGDNVGVFLGNGDGTFQAPALYPTLNGPSAVAAADFNGDGIEDLAVVDGGSAMISVLLGEALGTPSAVPTTTTLQSSPNPASSSQPITLTATVVPASATGAVEFLDGTTVLGVEPLVSGRAELVASLLANGSNSLRAIYSGAPAAFLSSQSELLNQGVSAVPSAGFAAAIAVADLEATGLGAGDFNRDGKTDLAVVQMSGNLTILLGNGDGTFRTGMTYPLGALGSWASVAVSDFNGDGFSDLLVDGGVLLGNGDGTFQPPKAASGYLVADMNNDGVPDLVGPGSIQLGYGNGTFHSVLDFNNPNLGGFIGMTVTVADFNGDGKPDVAVSNFGSNNISVLFGNGDGTVQPPIDYTVASSPVAITAGDFNGDGLPDLAVMSGIAPHPGTVSILMNNGSGMFQAAGTYLVPNSGPLVVSDFNGDRKTDLAVGGYGPAQPFAELLLGNGNGTFQPPSSYTIPLNAVPLGTQILPLVVGDFNGDGRADLAIGGVTILLGSSAPLSGYACTNTAAVSISSIESASSYGGYSYFASGSWLEIKGSNLADPADPRMGLFTNPGQWTANDFNGVNAPTSLDGVSVSVDGKPAYVWYLSPTQLNVQAPEDSTSGNVEITVTNCKATSPQFASTRQALAPGLLAPPNYSADGKQYLVATFVSDGAYVLTTSLGASFGLNSRPAKPGDQIIAYGVGFGDVSPSILPGTIAQQANALKSPVAFSFGSVSAQVSYAGLAAGFVGLYEFYITVPPALANGDSQINVTQNGAAVPQTIYLTIQN